LRRHLHENPGGYPPPAKASHHARTAMGRAVGSPHGWGDGPMTAVLTRARAELRARRASMIALTLLVGIGAATVMTLAAGARRTRTASTRSWSHSTSRASGIFMSAAG